MCSVVQRGSSAVCVTQRFAKALETGLEVLTGIVPQCTVLSQTFIFF